MNIKSIRDFEKGKRCQQETVGFVIIILMVMIIGVIFLGLSLRKKSPVTIDAEISNFLTASARYTTDCEKSYAGDYRPLEDVIAYCYSQTSCLDGRSSCEALNQTYREMLENFRPGGKTLDYYRLSFYYVANMSLSIEEGGGAKFTSDITSGNRTNCHSRRSGRNYINLGAGNLIEEIEVCIAS